MYLPNELCFFLSVLNMHDYNQLLAKPVRKRTRVPSQCCQRYIINLDRTLRSKYAMRLDINLIYIIFIDLITLNFNFKFFFQEKQVIKHIGYYGKIHHDFFLKIMQFLLILCNVDINFQMQILKLSLDKKYIERISTCLYLLNQFFWANFPVVNKLL